MLQKALMILIVLAMVAPVAACGRKGAPSPPPDAEPTRAYPSQ